METQDARSLLAEAQEDLRRRVVEAVQKGLSQTEVARVFGVARQLCLSKTSIWVRRWELWELCFFIVLPRLIFLASLLATLPSILRSRAALELENLALRHQIGVLQRSARKRPKLILLDRLLWAALSRVWQRVALGAGHRST